MSKICTLILLSVFIISLIPISSAPMIAESSLVSYGDGYKIITHSDGRMEYVEGIKTFKLWNGSYIPAEQVSGLTKITQVNESTYEIEGIFGGLRIKWDGLYYYSEIYAPDTKEIKSYGVWTRVESLKTPPPSGTWQEEIVTGVIFQKVSDTKLIAYCTLSSGGKLNHTYEIVDNTKIKESYEVTTGYARRYRVVKRIDSIPSQGSLDNSSKKFNTAFFDNELLWTWNDIQPYTVNRTYNETSGQWEGDGSYLYGYNTTQYIDNNNHRFYQTVGIDKVRVIGEKFVIDPTWTVGIGGNSWSGNVTYDNTTKVISTGKVELRQQVDDYVSYWRFDENTGIMTWDENITNNNTGTWSGNATGNWTTGKFGNALSFDGVNDYVDCGNVLDVINKLTVEAWVKDSGSSTGNVVGKYEAMDKRWHIYVNSGGDGKIYWNIGGANYATSLTSAIGTAWHHIVMVYDGTQIGNAGKLKAYIDATPITLTYTGTIPVAMPAISANVNIGRHSTNNFFNGIIDEVRIYNRALSNDEINQTMVNSKYTAGNLSSVVKDATSGYVWKNIGFNATIPANTNVSIYANTSTDNSSFSGWQLVQSNANGDGTQYTIPAAYQKQYGAWQLQLQGNVTETPEIIDVTFYSAETAVEDTSFTVSLPTGYTYALFQPQNASATNYPPDGQTDIQPFYNITNSGNVNLNVRMQLNATVASITLKADTDNNPSGAKEVNTTLVTLYSGLTPTNSIDIWLWSDFNHTIPQTTNKTLSVNVTQS